MPTYEYRCVNGHEFEKFFRTMSTAKTELACPQCGALGVRFLSAGSGLVFKGSGFYLTDYGKNAHANRGDSSVSAQADGAGESASSESGGGKQSAEETRRQDSSVPASASGGKSPPRGDAKPSAAAAESGKSARKGEEKKSSAKRGAKSDS
jgi:putative FmdB family regulatory protein